MGGGFVVAVVQAQYLFFGSEPRDIEAQQCQRKEEDFETPALFGGAITMVAVAGGGVAIYPPRHKIKNTAEHHAANGQTQQNGVILIDKLIHGVGGQHPRQTDRGAQADNSHGRRNTAAENMRQNGQRADKACGAAEVVGVHILYM